MFCGFIEFYSFKYTVFYPLNSPAIIHERLNKVVTPKLNIIVEWTTIAGGVEGLIIKYNSMYNRIGTKINIMVESISSCFFNLFSFTKIPLF